jgi:predicted site-specific integrase-resolvase
VDSVVADELAMLIVAHQDRWARFGFERLEPLRDKHGCELLVLDTGKVSPEQARVPDWMAITHSFSSRWYGSGNDRRALKEAFQ